MKKINTRDLRPGMITAEDVYTESNQFVLSKGIAMTDNTIAKLEFYNILSIRIEDDEPQTTSSYDIGSGPSYSERIRSSEEFIEFKENFETVLDNFKDQMNQIISSNGKIDTSGMLAEATGLLNLGRKSHINIFTMLQNMRDYDDSTYAHCINVALISNMLAKWLRFSDEDADLATACGLLHDIGKLKIPPEIIQKPAKLTEKEFKIVKTHTIEGYQILKERGVDPRICNAALMHHERCDGSGYPLRLPGDQLDSFTKIVSIADVYDAMTAARVYRGPMCPFTVIDIMQTEGLQCYDPAYYMTFMQNVTVTYLLNRVRLSDGREGDVVFINPDRPSKPTVLVGQTYLDLSQQSGLNISEIV